ncbi:MAG: DUF4388 domain-containing protein [Holophaga sp.]
MSQGLIQGSMREAPLPDIIQLVSQSGKSGCFHVVDDHKRAKIYLKDGKLVHAVTNDTESIDAIYEVALWLDGSYHFEEGTFEITPSITKSNAAVLMEMHRRMDEWRVISQKISSLDLYPFSTLLPGETPHGVNPRQARILSLITGWYTVAELAIVMQKPVLTIAKDLYDLVMTGQIVLKGMRSGKKPELPADLAPAVETPVAAPVPQVVAAPVNYPPQGFPVVTERLDPEPEPEPEPEPVPATIPVPMAEAPKPPMGGTVTDPVKITKLNAFGQRIATTARGALPPQHHDMVNALLADSALRVNAGEGPEAVKNLALSISRGAVDAGCDADMVKNLNAQLKALFSK